MRRSITVLATTAAAGAVFVPTASAASACPPPSALTWHSCLSASHRPIKGTDDVRLTRVKAVLVVRMSACPAELESRRVAIRTAAGKRIAGKKVEGTCRHDVARWRFKARPNIDLRSGTKIASYWAHIPDSDSAPSVQLGKKKKH